MMYPRGGGGLLHESDGDARRLAQGCKLRILVSFRVHRTESQYFDLYRYRFGLCVKKYLYKKNQTLSTFSVNLKRN